MWDLIIESASWKMGGVTLQLQLTESKPGVRFVTVLRHHSGDEFPTAWTQPEPYSSDEHRESLARFEELLDGFTEKHGEPTERVKMVDPRYHADREAVLREARSAGLEISESDIMPGLEDGTLSIHDMPWWEWLEAVGGE
ncbi:MULTISPECIES: hypothetical protein [unclassified Streptomyces]|uniref:hypothetical protein n=1 Tax=unclassified Streptomyces TaxID=2593676 RepID=UPI000B805BAF|nr:MULTISPECIES: hypothetical protein [unclassified Streptomyces]MYR95478.1 hypothetical protein [Streptomyces sp. SID4937]